MNNDEWIDKIFNDFCLYLINNIEKKDYHKLFFDTYKLQEDIDKYFINNNFQEIYFSFLKNIEYDIPHSIFIKIDISKLLQHALIKLT